MIWLLIVCVGWTVLGAYALREEIADVIRTAAKGGRR